jgi:hypothetical protein
MQSDSNVHLHVYSSGNYPGIVVPSDDEDLYGSGSGASGRGAEDRPDVVIPGHTGSK